MVTIDQESLVKKLSIVMEPKTIMKLGIVFFQYALRELTF